MGNNFPERSRSPLPDYTRELDYVSLKQSSYDHTGGNKDHWPIAPGRTIEIFNSNGPGVITHIWFTVGSDSSNHLKELVLRMYWDGESKPSVEVPLGDFFGLNLGSYSHYQSAFTACSSVRALNSYFAMPFAKSARLTVSNEGKIPLRDFYSNIDYQLVPSLPERTLYFHAQYRQATPTPGNHSAKGDDELNPVGKNNYVFVETRGKGHLMGVTLGVLQNRDQWMGEGDDMTFIDDEAKPAIVGTGCEDYFNGAHDFKLGPFAYWYHGAHLISNPELAGGRYCMYRWHGDNPITFRRYLKHTIEYGHANERDDCYYSVAYWYQSDIYTDFPALPKVEDRIPMLKL